MSSNIPEGAKSILNTAQTSSARATFLAGFTFYQIGRYGFTVGTDTSYIFFCTFSCMLAILAACISCYITYFMERAKTYEGKEEFTKTINNLYIRGAFQAFSWGTVFYALGLARIGFVYYPASSAKWIPFVIFVPSAIIGYGTQIWIAFQQYSIIEDENKNKETGNSKISELESASNDRRVEKSASSEPLDESKNQQPSVMKMQCDLISGRSLFVAGMIQAGVMRYIPMGWNTNFGETPQGEVIGPQKGVHDESNYTGFAYLFFCVVGTALPLFAAMTLSTVSIFIEDCPTHHLKVLYCKRIEKFTQRLVNCFNVGVLCAVMGIILMPWGCNYSSYWQSSVFLGIMCFCVIIYTFLNIDRVKDEIFIFPVHTCDIDEAKSNANRMLTQCNNNGRNATLASSFVFYNIVTFYTDILLAKESLPGYSYIISSLFLIFNNFSIIAGLTAGIVDVSITNACIGFYDSRDVYHLLNRCRGLLSIVDVLWYSTIGGWFAVFVFFGYAKIFPHTAIPLAFGIIGVLITLGGVIYLDYIWSWNRYLNSYIRVSGVDHPENDSKELITKDHMAQYDTRLDSFNSIAFNVLFLGGFAYNAISFFGFNDFENSNYAGLDRAYVGLMSVAFALSLIIVSWTSFYSIHLTNCESALERFQLARSTSRFYQLVVFIAYLVIICLTFAFTVIGYMKSHDFYLNYAKFAPIMLIFALVSFLIYTKNIIEIFYYYSQAKAMPENSSTSNSTSDKIKYGDFSYQRLLLQLTVSASACSFVAGNVCYDILFSQAIAPKAYKAANYVYFCLINWTFAAGVAVVAIQSTCNYIVQLLPREEQRVAFGRDIRGIKTKVFVLTASALGTWMISITFLGLVKYNSFKDFLYWPSLSAGIIGSLFYLHMAINLKLISNRIVAKEKKLEESREVELNEPVTKNPMQAS